MPIINKLIKKQHNDAIPLRPSDSSFGIQNPIPLRSSDSFPPDEISPVFCGILSDPEQRLKVLLFLEKQAKANNRSVDEQAARDGHDHGLDTNEARVREDDGKGCGNNVSKRFISHLIKQGRGRGREGENVPMPIMTKNPVKNRPTSTMAAPALSTKSSGLAHRPQIQLGMGATT